MYIRKIILFISTLFVTSYAVENVYVYINVRPSYYYQDKHKFFVELFGPGYKVQLVSSLRNLEDPAYIITEEVPHKDSEIDNLKKYPLEKRLLFSFETMISHPRSHNPAYCDLYQYVFTWNDNFIDNGKFFKVRYPWMDPRPVMPNVPSFEKRSLSVFVGNNIGLHSPHANYQARNDLVDFFERRAPHHLNVYGGGQRWRGKKVYKGRIPQKGNRRVNKINTLKNYIFDFAYENTINVNGWISERIWESFAAGCIPIYWGSNNILDYIPENCLILRSRFASNEEMYTFMQNFTQEDYDRHLSNIKKFLASECVYFYSTPYYISQIRAVLNID